MRILYAVGFSGWWGAYPPDVLDREDSGTVGGGETCALRTAAGLAARGHEVSFCSVAQAGEWRGVRFYPWQRFVSVYLNKGPWDALVAFSDAGALRFAVEGEARILVQQLNDLLYPGEWWRWTDVICAASPVHETYLRTLAEPAVLAPGGPLWQPVSNGVDPTLFPHPAPAPVSRPPWVGYWSSPDRGLIHLLDAWPRIRERVPAARLKVFYQVRKYIEHVRHAILDGRAIHVGRLLAERLAALAGDGGVDLMDALPRRALAREQVKCRVMCYPCNPDGFTEGFGQAVPEAMLAGALPVVRCADAFADLWQPAVVPLVQSPASEEFIEEIVEKVVWGLTVWDGTQHPSLNTMRARALPWSWERAAESVERAIVAARGRRLAEVA